MTKTQISKVRIGLVFGGKTTEHEISVISALQAKAQFNTEKYEIIPIYISKNNDWYVGKDIGDIEKYGDIPSLLKNSFKVTLVNKNDSFYLEKTDKKMFASPVYDRVDIIFPVVHGTNVEDGCLQGYLKTIGIPFCGCDVTASALGMDKAAQKAVLRSAGIPVLDCTVLYRKDYYTNTEERIADIEKTSSYPVIIKPVNLGSSIGISKAKDREALKKSIDNAFSYAEKVLVESAVLNLKEINCSVLGDSEIRKISVCEEPHGNDEILSFADKYLSGGKSAKKPSGKSAGMADLSRKLPADISSELEQKVREYASETFKVLGCCGVSRIDFLYNTVSGELYVNEINTIPGSLSFYLWEASGVKFCEMLDEVVSLGFKRDRLNKELNYTFDTNILKGYKFSGSKGKL